MSVSAEQLVCEVFGSPRRPGTYLYVEQECGLERVPEALLESFGEPRSVLVVQLHPARRLAQADTVAVMRSVRDQGFYLQLPPSERPRNPDPIEGEGREAC